MTLVVLDTLIVRSLRCIKLFSGADPGVEIEGGHYGERGARAYNGGLGAVLPAGSRGRAPGQGVRGASPPEAERFLVLSYV